MYPLHIYVNLSAEKCAKTMFCEAIYAETPQRLPQIICYSSLSLQSGLNSVFYS